MTVFPPLILASTSPHRRALLGRLGLAFQCVAPGVSETGLPGEAPSERATRLALEKAQAVAGRHPEAIVIGSDQVGSFDSDAGSVLLHKPGNREACHRQLRALSGRTARFDTALAVLHRGVAIPACDVTTVRFRILDDATIADYIDREPAFDCAGGFKCEGLGVKLFESVGTTDPTALVGLPLIALCGALSRLGVPV